MNILSLIGRDSDFFEDDIKNEVDFYKGKLMHFESVISGLQAKGEWIKEGIVKLFFYAPLMDIKRWVNTQMVGMW